MEEHIEEPAWNQLWNIKQCISGFFNEFRDEFECHCCDPAYE